VPLSCLSLVPVRTVGMLESIAEFERRFGGSIVLKGPGAYCVGQRNQAVHSVLGGSCRMGRTKEGGDYVVITSASRNVILNEVKACPERSEGTPARLDSSLRSERFADSSAKASE
jgi:hypothetical protein